MFKRGMALFLVLVLAFGLVACGNKEDKKPTEPEVEQTQPTEKPIEKPTEPNDTEDKEDETKPDDVDPSEPEESKPEDTEPTKPADEMAVNWTTDFIDTPLLQSLRVTQQDVVPGIRVKIATTPFSFNSDEMVKKLGEVDFLKQHYSSLALSSKEKYDNEYYTNGGYAFSYAGNDEIIAATKANSGDKFYKYGDLRIGGARNTAEYSNYYSLYIDMKSLPANAVTQESIKPVCDLVFGEWTYYLLNAEDMDDRDLDGNKLAKGQLHESVTASDGTIYYFTRKITKNEDGTVDVYLSVGVYNNPHRDTKVTTYGKNVQPLYLRFSKKMTDIFPKPFGMSELTQYRTFGDAYFNGQKKETPYTFTELTRCETATFTSPNGQKYYSFDGDFVGWCEGNKSSKFSLAYSYFDGSQTLSDMNVVIYGDTHLFDSFVDVADRSKAGKMIMEDIKKSISVVLTEADVSSLVYDDAQSNSKAPYERTYSVPAKFLHKEVTARVTVKMGSSGDVAEGSLNYGNYTIKISW